MNKLITIQQMVEAVLRQYPGTRDDDRELIQTLYGKYYGIDSIDPEEYKKIGFANLSWTEYPVYRIPAEIVNITASSGGFGPRSADNADYRIYD